MELAYHYRQLENHEAALTHYRSALDAHPNDLQVLLQLSGFLLELGAENEALNLCRRGIAQHPEDARISALYFNQGYVHMRNERYAEARTAFEQVVKWDPNSAKAWNNLGNVQLALGETDAARQALTAAVAADSGIAEAHYNLGSLFLQDRQLQQALQAYLASIAADSTFIRAYYALATVYKSQGAMAEAGKAYQLFIDKWQGDPNFLRQARQQLAQLPKP